MGNNSYTQLDPPRFHQAQRRRLRWCQPRLWGWFQGGRVDRRPHAHTGQPVCPGTAHFTGQCWRPAAPLPPVSFADTILVNGNIVTMDAKRTAAKALAVKDGNILLVGDDQAVRPHGWSWHERHRSERVAPSPPV